MGSGGTSGGCSLCRVINIAVTLALLGGVGYVIWYFLGKPTGDDIANTFGNIDFGDFSNVLDNFTGIKDLWNNDPFVGDNTTNVWKGTNGQGGLTLELWNALDDTWQDEYAESFNDWDNCNPNVLTLSSQQVAVDNACSQVDGVMKVCNGNYGDSGWLGLNEILKIVQTSEITSSVARMNEYYLNNAGYDERLYTMCHEIGHGFGLPHTDENFNNADLGNCLDYTNRPSNNLRPGEYNCNRLKTMYGSVDGSRLLRGAGHNFYPITGRSLMQSSVPITQYENVMKELDRLLSTNPGSRRTLYDDDVEPVEHEWRVLRNHPRGGAFVRRLSQDMYLEVYAVYPFN